MGGLEIEQWALMQKYHDMNSVRQRIFRDVSLVVLISKADNSWSALGKLSSKKDKVVEQCAGHTSFSLPCLG